MLVFFSIFRTFGGEPPSRARDVPCAIGIRREGRSYVSQTIVAHQFQEYRSGGVSADPGDQLFRGRQRGGQDHERSDGRGEQIVCSFARRGGKTLKRNGKEYDRLSDHVGLVPVVIVSPADTALVSDAADERRRYLNGCISQLDRGYLSAVMRYNAVLSERNRYLKVGSDEDMLSIYDRQLAEHGQAIYEKRKAFAERLQPLVGEYYALLSGRREQVELTYRSELAEAPFTELLQRARQRDLANQFTTAGIHRDDLVLRIDGYPLRKYGSQGQQKSFLVALKLAQYRIVGADKGEKPILLLDDLFDKLDMGRVEQLIKLVSGEEFGQIVITDCNKVRLETILGRQGGDYRLYVVANGEIAK